MTERKVITAADVGEQILSAKAKFDPDIDDLIESFITPIFIRANSSAITVDEMVLRNRYYDSLIGDDVPWSKMREDNNYSYIKHQLNIRGFHVTRDIRDIGKLPSDSAIIRIEIPPQGD